MLLRLLLRYEEMASMPYWSSVIQSEYTLPWGKAAQPRAQHQFPYLQLSSHFRGGNISDHVTSAIGAKGYWCYSIFETRSHSSQIMRQHSLRCLVSQSWIKPIALASMAITNSRRGRRSNSATPNPLTNSYTTKPKDDREKPRGHMCLPHSGFETH